MNGFLSEIPWVLLAVALSAFIGFFLLRFNFMGEGTIDINIHDTYFVIQSYDAIYMLFFSSLFLIYVFRSVKKKFKSHVILFIVSIAGLGLFVVFNIISGLLYMIRFGIR